MATWIQSLSWTLIYSLGQGFAVYAMLWLVFKLMPVTSANVRYNLSLSALTTLLLWFVATWWQQFHSISLANEQLLAAHTADTVIVWPSPQYVSITDGIGNLRQLQSSLSVFFPWLSACYIVGLVLMLARLSAGMVQLFSLRTSGTFQPDTALNELLLVQVKRIRMGAPVKLLISAKAQVPMVIGFLKPVILLPAAAIAQLEPEQLETILLHELAHIKRHDYLVNILQSIVETILFFNPFVWMIATIARREREHCCDDLVVNYTPEPLYYVTALAALASRRAVPPMVVAATGQRTHLFNRIQRIMEAKKNPFSYSRMVASIIIVVTITCSIAWIKPTFSKVQKSRVVAARSTQKQKPGVTKLVSADVNDEDKEKAPVADANLKPIEAPVVCEDVTSVKEEKTDKEVLAMPVDTQVTKINIPEENILVQRLLDDKLVDQVNGFSVEKQHNKLYINGQLQTEDIADRYLSGIKKEVMRLQVFSLEERMRLHPDASLIQLLLPFTFESPCVSARPAKEGC